MSLLAAFGNIFYDYLFLFKEIFLHLSIWIQINPLPHIDFLLAVCYYNNENFQYLEKRSFMPNLGYRIRELRMNRGLKLEQVAAETGDESAWTGFSSKLQSGDE